MATAAPEGRLAELQPTAAREAALAFLDLQPLAVRADLDPNADRHGGRRRSARRGIARAWPRRSETLERALQRGGSIGHSGREEMQREDAYKTLASWRKELR